MTDDVKVSPAAHLPKDFWEARGTLRHVRQAAHSRQRSADAVLHAVLARVAAGCSHHVALPPTVGSACPVCYFAIVLAPPGIGKSGGSDIAAELLPLGLNVADRMPIGSGEGIVEVLFDYVPDPDWDGRGRRPPPIKMQVRNNVYLYVDEGQMLGDVGKRDGSTLLGTLRSIWTGGKLGNTNASRERKRIVEAGSYTYGLVVGMQTTKAGDLLRDAPLGTPQRFAWALAFDPSIPDDTPDWPGVLKWEAEEPVNVGRYDLTLPESVRREIKAADLDRARTGRVADELDAHEGLLRLKMAALLGLLEGRLHVTEEDWELASVLKESSDATRQMVVATVRKVDEVAEHRQATRLANRAVVADDARAAAERKRRVLVAAEKLAVKVWAAEREWTRGDLRGAMRSYRDDFDEAYEHATAMGWVVEVEEPSHTGDAKRLVRPGERRPS